MAKEILLRDVIPFIQLRQYRDMARFYGQRGPVSLSAFLVSLKNIRNDGLVVCIQQAREAYLAKHPEARVDNFHVNPRASGMTPKETLKVIRDYEIVRNGRHLVVNGREIVPEHPFTLETLTFVYELFREGRSLADIKTDFIGEYGKIAGALSEIERYLTRAGIYNNIPRYRPAK